jgi:hypothetical protein
MLPTFSRIVGVGLLGVFALPAGAVASEVDPPPSASVRRALSVLQRFDLPLGIRQPLDVRWAGHDSIFVSVLHRGVLELDLKAGLPLRSTPIDLSKHSSAYSRGGKRFAPTHLAVSHPWLVFSNTASVRSWVRLDENPESRQVHTERTFGLAHDMDVQDGVVALLGVADVPAFEKSVDRPIVWVADLDSRLASWRPLEVTEKVTKSGDAQIFRHFNGAAQRAIRYMPDGRLVVGLPQLGVFVLSSTGRTLQHHTLATLLRQAGAEELDSARGEAGQEAGEPILGEIPDIGDGPAALDRVVLIDDILPFKDGPGLILRMRGRGGFVWKLLLLTDSPELLDLPIAASAAGVRLRGDVNDRGRVVVLLADRANKGWLSDEERGGEVVILARP